MAIIDMSIVVVVLVVVMSILDVRVWVCASKDMRGVRGSWINIDAQAFEVVGCDIFDLVLTRAEKR